MFILNTVFHYNKTKTRIITIRRLNKELWTKRYKPRIILDSTVREILSLVQNFLSKRGYRRSYHGIRITLRLLMNHSTLVSLLVSQFFLFRCYQLSKFYNYFSYFFNSDVSIDMRTIICWSKPQPEYIC